MDFLDRLRQKPREVKNRYAILTAVLITGVIGSVWMFSLPARFATITNATHKEGNESSGLSGFLDSVESQVGSAVESLRNAEFEAETTVDNENISFSSTSTIATSSESEVTSTKVKESDNVAAISKSSSASASTTAGTISTTTPTDSLGQVILIATSTHQKSD